ncbi:hypothetical protein MLD38_022462 [Melastoma candidum]|uniref:Uncharacterized protein n=1 Tax=Melastoma candidum TaxID=119954 RepID=A0ACB9QIH6_9MYRT|nr:hypothetical protein MLD38_022462 [Melastoma candidum]
MRHVKMTVDESFKRPGAVPFKWEIRPGVPKLHPPTSSSSSSSLLSPDILKPPPPSSANFSPPPDVRTHSFRSPRRLMMQPAHVSSSGCFFLSRYSLRHDARGRSRGSESQRICRKGQHDVEDARSWSSRWLISPVGESPSPSRWSIEESTSPSPRFSSVSYGARGTVSDGLAVLPVLGSEVEWAGFGLF